MKTARLFAIALGASLCGTALLSAAAVPAQVPKTEGVQNQAADASARTQRASERFVVVPPDRPIRIETSGGGPPAWMPPLVALVTSLIALVATLMAVNRTNRQNAANNRAGLDRAAANTAAATNQRANELEVARIETWLSNFFGPFMQLSEENKRLAELLRSRQHDPGFRTLRALLDPNWRKAASATDLSLISRIVGTGTALRGLIREKAGPTNPALSEYLALAAAHFTILELADAGALTEQTEDFDQYVYPRQLDAVLKLERERLETRRNELLSDLSKRHSAAPALEIPADLSLSGARCPS